MEEGKYTREGSNFLAAIARANVFPLVCADRSRTIIRGSISLAISLLAVPKIALRHTRVMRHGSPRLRLSPLLNEVCRLGDKTQCFARRISSFTRNKQSICSHPECDATNEEAFLAVTQKMVDCMLACDAIHLAHTRSAASVMILTDDWDLIPCLLAVGSGGANVTWARRNVKRHQLYDEDLRQNGVALRNWR